MKKSFIAIAIISGIVIGAIIGFGGLAGLSHTGIKADSTGASSTIITKPSDSISTSDAKSIILNKVPGGVITNFYYATTDTYDATVVNGKNEYSIKVNAKTGAISNFEQTSSNFTGTISDVNADIVSENDFISADKAKEIAQSKIPNATITGFTLNYQGITPEYDIVLTTSSAKNYVCINAKSGEVISNKPLAITSSNTTTN